MVDQRPAVQREQGCRQKEGQHARPFFSCSQVPPKARHQQNQVDLHSDNITRIKYANADGKDGEDQHRHD